MDNLLQKLMLGGSTAALVAAMPIAGAFAQDAGGGDIEQVVVSASRITIAGYTQPTPVTVVGAAQLEKDAYSNIEDAVRNLPQVQSPPASFGASQGGGSPGSAGLSLVNLRNLGNTRTLILFDSQRVVVSNLTGGVDISTLPAAVIQRVDIVTGGASAAWGSDAVAGVVNFVLNKNFTGLKAGVEAGDTYNGLNRSVASNVAWGGDIDGGRGHLILAGTYLDRPDTTLMVNENWYRGAYWVSNPAFVAGSTAPQLIVANNVGYVGPTGGLIGQSPAGTGPTPAPVNALRGIEFVGAGIPQLVNFGNLTGNVLSNGGSLTDADGLAPWQTISGPNSTYTFFGYGRYKLTDTIQASLQLNWGYFTGKGDAQSFQQINGTGVVIKSDNAFIPASVRATMQSGGITSFNLNTDNGNNFPPNGITGDQFYKYAASGLAPAETQNRRQLQRAVFTLEGTIGDDWSWNAYYEHSTVRFWAHILGGDVIEANMENAYDAITVTTANRGTTGLPLGSIACRSTLTGTPFVFSGVTAQSGCIPLDPFGNGVASANAIRYATGGNPDFEHETMTQDVAEGEVQGTLPWQLPAGPVAIAFGAGYRKEGGKNNGTLLGSEAAYATANYTNFPSSSYNVMEGFAEVDAPILKNNIVNSLDFSMAGRMTSYSTSGLVETWKLGLSSQVNDDVKLRTTWSVDIRAPQLSDLFSPATVNTTSSTDPKTHTTVTAITFLTGNPNLNPEVARTISGGAVLTPTFLDGFSMSADWYSISLTGGLGTVATGTVLNQCDPTKASIINPGQLGNINDPLCTHLVFSGPNGSLSQIINTTLNLQSQTVSGLDVQANYNMDFWDGTIAWSAFANLEDEDDTNPGGGTAKQFGVGFGGTPKWKGVLSADYTTGPYSFTVQGRWYGASRISATANTGPQATAQTANLYDPAHFEVPVVAYLDLRGSYKWNDNVQLYGAIDNATNAPPALVPPTQGSIQNNGGVIATNSTTYDMLGRAFRFGVRFTY
jgi:outer membrane receptor protein involved in Fe transport